MSQANERITGKNTSSKSKTCTLRPLTMIFFRTIIILFCLVTADGCSNSTFRPVRQDYEGSEYVIVPFWQDSIPIMPSTKYFYRYTLRDFKDRKVTIEWVFGNLNHFGIHLNEAWYYEGASNTYLGNDAVGATIVPPSFIAGLTELSIEILDHHFELMEHFDPLVHPNGPQSRLTHYVRNQTK